MGQPQSPNTALLLIDIQKGFDDPVFWGRSRSNPFFETNISSLLSSYRRLVALSPSTHKIIHVAHSSTYSPLQCSLPGFEFQDIATPLPSETVMVKHVNSAFIGTSLHQTLHEHFRGKAGKLWVVGLSTDHCVSTTVRMAQNLGVCDGKGPDGWNGVGEEGRGEKGELVLIEDATAAFEKGEFAAELVHKVHVQSLKGEFAEIRRTSEVLEEWEGILGRG